MAEREKRHTDTRKLEALFIEKLKEAYWLEKKLVRTLRKFQEIATTGSVKQIFAEHSEQTQTHISRLELIFNLIDIPTCTKICPIISDIADSSTAIIQETRSDTSKRDVRLALAAQKAERYEIAIYTGLIELTHLLEYADAEPIFHKTLREEQQANELFLDITKSTPDYETGSRFL